MPMQPRCLSRCLPRGCSFWRENLGGSAQGPAGRPPSPPPHRRPVRGGAAFLLLPGGDSARPGATGARQSLPVENIRPRGLALVWAVPLPPAPRRPARAWRVPHRGAPDPAPPPPRAGLAPAPRRQGPFPPPPHLARPRRPHRRRRGGCRACWAGREGTGATYRGSPLPRRLRLLGRPRFRPPRGRGRSPLLPPAEAGGGRRRGGEETCPRDRGGGGRRCQAGPRERGRAGRLGGQRGGGEGVSRASLGAPGVAGQRSPRPQAAGRAGRPWWRGAGCRTAEPGSRKWRQEGSASASCLRAAVNDLEIVCKEKNVSFLRVCTHAEGLERWVRRGRFGFAWVYVL